MANPDQNEVDHDALLRSIGITSAAKPERPVRDLNEVVHSVLIVGLYASVVFMVAGIAIDLIRRRALPNDVLSIGEALSRTIHLRASGYFSLGLLLLILTPLLRVIGSALVFLSKRNWRYTAVTLVVLLVMTVSIWVGEG